MIIATELRKATDHIGTRVVATTDDGRRAVELYDWNKSADENHHAAAKQIAPNNPVFMNQSWASGDVRTYVVEAN